MAKKEYDSIKTNFATLDSFKDKYVELRKEYYIEPDVTTIIQVKKLKEKDKFVKVFQLGLDYFIDHLSPSGCKLFMYFISISQYQNLIEVDQKVILERLKISRTSLNKGLKELQEINMIKVISDLNDARRNTYIMNHYVSWKGNPLDRAKSIKNKKEDFRNPYQLLLELSQEKK